LASVLAEGDVDHDLPGGGAYLKHERFFMLAGHLAVEAVISAIAARLDDNRVISDARVSLALAAVVDTSFTVVHESKDRGVAGRVSAVLRTALAEARSWSTEVQADADTDARHAALIERLRASLHGAELSGPSC
jgi:hypothetical protein